MAVAYVMMRKQEVPFMGKTVLYLTKEASLCC